MSRYGDALLERRELRGFATASDLAKKSKEVADQLQDPQMVAFSQQTLSRLEGDKTGEFIANARPRIQRMLSYLLGWSAEEFEASVGVSIPAVPNFPNPTSTDAERRGWTLPPAAEPEIPAALLEAAQKYGTGEHAPLAERRWLLELAGLDFRDEPETPEDWLALYVRLSKVINPR